MELYDRLFRDIWADEVNRKSITHVLLWVVFQREGLTPAELSIALALTKAIDNARGRKIGYNRMYELLDENIELWVNRFCGHLIKLENGRFELIHPSLRNYLTMNIEQLRKEYGDVHKGSNDDLELPYHADFYMDPSEGHARLGRICAAYLAFPFFDEPLWPECGDWVAWQDAVKGRIGEHKFLRYAALYWLKHLELSRDLATPGSSIKELTIDRVRWEKLEKTQSWIEVGCYFHDWHKDKYPYLCSIDTGILHEPSQLNSDPNTTGTEQLDTIPPNEIQQEERVKIIIQRIKDEPPYKHWLVRKVGKVAEKAAEKVVKGLRLEDDPKNKHK
ncbi:hypothetical protein ONZ43_g2869 [Nemania bipapillata]|uniref:Uncharacterized protein n=1 Tax=Nemania bipapillata TaxID=110536 RepID=A0ACC2IYX6_9PEZI|nr:hypothetical protein ONZ43_g2869 [Nemania bipapillata]